MKLSPEDRVMIVAAHPDDETLAAGGLIQHAIKAGAAARVLMVTNGDNNPWPQRWMEKRWRIGPAERQRWGAMRSREALAALETLGFTGKTEFLGFPDQGLSGMLMTNDAAAMNCICAALREWNPTLLVLPSHGDQHPDHNALHLLIQIALLRLGLEVPQLHYAVHCKHRDLIPLPFSLALDEAECRRKRDAIGCHKSQMLLSSRRFLAYARREEDFFKPAPAEKTVAWHPIREASLEGNEIRLGIHLPVSFRSVLWIVGETESGESLRWELPIPVSSQSVPIKDCTTGAVIGQAEAKIDRPLMHFNLPATLASRPALVYVKYHRVSVFLDPSGWRQVRL